MNPRQPPWKGGALPLSYSRRRKGDAIVPCGPCSVDGSRIQGDSQFILKRYRILTKMFSISHKHRQIIIEHALEEDPNECCGILVGKNGAVEKVRKMTNTAASPYRYDMDPSELMRILDLEYEEAENELVAIYHSHTHSQAYPSDTDVRLAPTSFFPDAFYILVSLLDKDNPDFRSFRIEDGMVKEEELVVE